MVTTRPPKTIVKPTALGPVANTDTKLLIYGLFQKGRVLAQDGVQRDTGGARQLNRSSPSCLKQAGSANRFLPRAAILSSGPRGAVNSSLNYYNW